MSSAKALRRELESCELHHAHYTQQYNYLKGCIDDALQGFAPTLSWIVGPSRVGKSMLLDSMARLYPERVVDGVRQVDLLVVKLLPGISPLKLPTAVLEALRVPAQRNTTKDKSLDRRVRDQLRLADVKFTIFDEVSHIVEPGSKMPPRAAGDWFKSLMEDWPMSMNMTGVPRLEKLFASNEQLRYRAEARREFRPYNFNIPAERVAFASCVKTYITLFQKHGVVIDVPLDAMVKHCYLLGGGLIGLVSKFFIRLSRDALNGAADGKLNFIDCKSAADGIEQAGHPSCFGFERLDVSDVELNQSHAYVLESNLMSMRSSTKVERV
jgi:hypothetical protein